MRVNDYVIPATPKSRFQQVYTATGKIITGSSGMTSLPIDPSFDEQVLTSPVQVYPTFEDFPELGAGWILYVDIEMSDVYYWLYSEGGDDPEAGEYVKCANLRVWDGLDADKPEEGKTGWLYIATDINRVYLWNGTEYTDLTPIWFGSDAEKPESGKPGWLYVLTDLGIITIAGEENAYINITGVKELTANKPASITRTGDYEESLELSIDNATDAAVGVVQPDGTTIKVDADGKITGTKLTAGAGITLNPTTGVGTVTVTNSGVTSNAAGTGISVNRTTGAVTITNTGVTVNRAGTGISLNRNTGDITITNSRPYLSVIRGGDGNRSASIYPVFGSVQTGEIQPGASKIIPMDLPTERAHGWTLTPCCSDAAVFLDTIAQGWAIGVKNNAAEARHNIVVKYIYYTDIDGLNALVKEL